MRRYTVKRLTDELDRLLASRYPSIEVEAEVGQLSTPSSGHAYIVLRDHDMVLNAVCWRTRWSQLRYRPRMGERVVCRGKLAVYGGKGAYQLYINMIEPAGEGRLAAEIARRRKVLHQEGLLDPRRKRSLPPMPRFVGIATSITGAALQDFLKVSRERHPATRLLVAPCTVQGVTAPPSVIQAVELLLDDGRAEVIVVTRGGGGKEDLLPFQDLGLARFLAQCPVPVLSAVGHQVDTTLCDLVADVVAPTPSAAALTALPDGAALTQRVDELSLAMTVNLQRQLRLRRERVGQLKARLRHPGSRLRDIRARAVELEGRLRQLLERRLREHRLGIEALQPRLEHSLRARLPRHRGRVEELHQRLERAMSATLVRRRERVATALSQVEALSPAGVLARGYAVVVGPEGVIQRVDDAKPGAQLSVRVADGSFTVKVDPPAEGTLG